VVGVGPLGAATASSVAGVAMDSCSPSMSSSSWCMAARQLWARREGWGQLRERGGGTAGQLRRGGAARMAPVGGGGGAGRLRGGHHERRCRGESTNGMPGRRPSMTRVDKRHGTSAAIAAPFGTPRAAARARVPTVRVAPLRAVHRRAAWRATVARSELIRPSMDRNTSAFTFTRARCVAHPLMQQGRPTSCMKPPHLS